MFAPFIEDDVPFDEYCQCMEKDGTWAGHMELQAASPVTQEYVHSPGETIFFLVCNYYQLLSIWFSRLG